MLTLICICPKIYVLLKMIYGYIRVSSDKQTVENQRFEIEQFCRVNNWTVDGWIEETISGVKSYNKRRLGILLKRVRKGDTIICSELSRLGRSLFMVMEILSLCMKKGVRVRTIKDGYSLGDDIQSKVLAFAFALSAEIERNLISQRTKEALARKRAEGQHLGHPHGQLYAQKNFKLYRKDAQIRHLLAQGYSQRQIAEMFHTTRMTVSYYCKRFILPSE